MKTTFTSSFASDLARFVDQKRALGHPYDGSVDILRQFDNMCAQQFPDADGLTQDVCLAWAVKRPTEQANSFRNRLMPVREFARFLIRQGRDAYVLPVRLAKKGPRHVPRIYTPAELAAIWREADQIPPLRHFPVRHLVIPAILRLVYCCGLRPAEARKLQTRHVDLSSGRIDIAESKGHNQRHVWMADDLAAYLDDYNTQVEAALPSRTWFFPNSQDQPYTKVWLDEAFRDLRDKAGVTQEGEHPGRLYDCRHSHATHRLYQWIQEGKDLNAMVPYLSAHLGHAQLSDTFYYIHLVPELPAFAGRDQFADLLPEAGHDE